MFDRRVGVGSCHHAGMSAKRPEQLEDLALLIDPRLRPRQMRDGVEARLRFAGRRVKVLVPQELEHAGFPEMLGALLDEEAEVAAVGDDRDRWLATQDPDRSARDLREEWRRLERNATRLRTLLGSELGRFAAAERPPPERRPPSRRGPTSAFGGFGLRWMR